MSYLSKNYLKLKNLIIFNYFEFPNFGTCPPRVTLDFWRLPPGKSDFGSYPKYMVEIEGTRGGQVPKFFFTPRALVKSLRYIIIYLNYSFEIIFPCYDKLWHARIWAHPKSKSMCLCKLHCYWSKWTLHWLD